MESSQESLNSASTSFDSPPTASIVRKPSSKTTKRKQATLVNSSQMVTLYNGDGPEKFVVHKDFACHYSPVLQAAFNSTFIEGQTQEYRLQDTTEAAIRQLVNWFYTQKLDIRHAEGKLKKSEVDSKLKDQEDITLVELWVLADKLLIPRLQNEILEEMQRLRNKLHSVPLACFIPAYKKTPAGSPLRRFLVAGCAGGNLPSTFVQRKHKKLPKEMLIDILKTVKDALPYKTQNSLRPENNMAKYKVAEE